MRQLRRGWLGWAALVVVGACSSSVYAQENAVDPPDAAVAAPANKAADFDANVRASQGDFRWDKAAETAGMVFLVLVWIATAEWVNRDTQIFNLGFKKWNPVVFFPFVIAFLATAFTPLPFVARYPILWVVYLVTAIPYVVVHNKHVLPHQTVLTGSWWRHFVATLMGKIGVKVSGERIADYEKGAAVDLIAMGAAGPNEDNANLLIARQSPGYLLVKDLIADMVARRSDRALLEYGPQAVALKHEIDGVWHNGDARDRESGDVLLAVVKTLANLNAKERRAKQEGKFGAALAGQTYLCPISSQGVANGERVVISRLNPKARPHTYESLGMRDAVKQKWEELMARDRGLLVFSAMPAGGLSTMINASLDETDRLMRDFFAIEEFNRREAEIQNIAVHTYDAAKGETPAKLFPGIVRLYPNVYVARDLVDAESATLLMNEIPDDHLVITSIPAREAAEALLRLLQLKLPAKQFASVVTAVLYQRLIRKLCPDCKVGYTPPPDVLKKLGIPPGKVQQLYRPPKPEEIEKPCQTCQGIGYIGRTGIFELLVVNDQMREILVKQPNLDLLKKAARADGQRSLQEECILLVAKGVTSLQELQRVLK